MSRASVRSVMLLLLCLLWSIGIAGGVFGMFRYALTPEPSAAQITIWPSGSLIQLAKDRPTLLIALHPRCACSRASLSELAQLLRQTRNPLHVEILVYQFNSEVNAWSGINLTGQANGIVGATVRQDPGGAEARRFGMNTSGQVALYSQEGRLLFSGGITRERGHIGDNDGREAITFILAGQIPLNRHTPVFGCPIHERI